MTHGAGLMPQTRVLNREVRVVLEGVDKHGHLLGSLMYPEADTPVDLGEKLVSSGLAKVLLTSPAPPVQQACNLLRRGGSVDMQFRIHSGCPPAHLLGNVSRRRAKGIGRSE